MPFHIHLLTFINDQSWREPYFPHYSAFLNDYLRLKNETYAALFLCYQKYHYIIFHSNPYINVKTITTSFSYFGRSLHLTIETGRKNYPTELARHLLLATIRHYWRHILLVCSLQVLFGSERPFLTVSLPTLSVLRSHRHPLAAEEQDT